MTSSTELKAEPDNVLNPLVVVDRASLTYTVRSVPQQYGHRKLRDRFNTSRGVVTNKVSALQDISFIVGQGEAVGVIGTNGSGKSTLMKMVTGQLAPTRGRVLASSTPVLLGVTAALVGSISGHDNITLGCLAMGMKSSELEQKRQDIVDLSGLKESLHLPLKSYSSGMASRLQFAIATAVEPEVLVIDEALNTGDAQFRDRTRERIDTLREQAGCVFLVSHSLSTIQEMCTRVIWVEQGQMLMDGDPKEVTDAYSKYTIMMGRNRTKNARLLREEAIASLPRNEYKIENLYKH